jgi:hypothetical protein
MKVPTSDEFGNPERVRQLDLFPTAEIVPTSPLVGLRVRIERDGVVQACGTCGSIDAVLGSSAGPHAASIRCAAGHHMGWVSKQIAERLLEIKNLYGVAEPIVFRRGVQRSFTGSE